jgi:hypothetical protein
MQHPEKWGVPQPRVPDRFEADRMAPDGCASAALHLSQQLLPERSVCGK